MTFSQKSTPREDSSGHPWNEIYLGVNSKDEAFSVDVQVEPGFLIAGKPGSGKSVLLHTLIAHVKEHPEDWRFIGIDPANSEFSRYEGDEVTTYVANDLENAYRALDYAHREMHLRYTLMDLSKDTNFRELPDSPKALLVAVEEMNILFSPENGASEATRKKAASDLQDIARLGRSAGIVLALSMQNPEDLDLPIELKQTLSVHVAISEMNLAASQAVLGSIQPVSIPNKSGRALVSIFGNVQEVQLFSS